MSARDKFLHYFSAITKQFPLSLWQFTSQKKLFLPFYHVVSGEHLPHIKHLYLYKNERQFEADIDYLLKHFEPISIDSLIKQPAKPSMLFTFDDGLREMEEVVAPILKRKGIPAVFFLNSDYLDNKALMFRYKVSLLIEEWNKKKNNQNFAKNVQKSFQTENLTKILLAIQKDSEKLDEIAKLLEVSFENFIKVQQPYMRSDQVKSLIQQGFHIGSHSVSHPFYFLLSEEEKVSQTLPAQTFLRQNFALTENYFAFPFTDYGVSDSFFKNTLQPNFRFSFGGAGTKDELYPFHYQRTALEIKNKSAEELLKADFCYYSLLKLFRKNWIIRR